MENTTRKHFVLVHGACHGAWCWFEVVTLLRAEGYTVTVLDMAASGINPKQLDDLHTYSDYIEPLLSFMTALESGERVILVGHSAGGFDISVAMEKFPQKVAVGVFVTAFMPGPDFTVQAIQEKFNFDSTTRSTLYLDAKLTFNEEQRITSILFGAETLSTEFYQDSKPQDVTLATLLGRPYPMFHDSQSVTERTLTQENYGSVHRIFIICNQDFVITRELATWMIENNPPNEVDMISADHMVMFSKPDEFSSKLQAIAKKHC